MLGGLEEKKKTRVVYLEKTMLTHGLRLQLSSKQSIFMERHLSEESFLKSLSDAAILADCREKPEVEEVTPREDIVPKKSSKPKFKNKADPSRGSRIKQVYLFEFDTAMEMEYMKSRVGTVKKGVPFTPTVKALFRELKQGNTVVITWAQLTNSPFIIGSIADDTAYEFLLELFELGAVKISRYGGLLSPSHYMQVLLQKCLGEEEGFMLFNLPIESHEKELLQSIADALRYCSLAGIRDMWITSEGEEAERYKLIYRFLNLILNLSICEESAVSAKSGAKHSLEEFLHIAAWTLSEHDFKNPAFYKKVRHAVSIIEVRGKAISAYRSNRSVWLDMAAEKNSAEHLANMIVHICYNYTVEDSMNGICKRYDEGNFESSFSADLASRVLALCKEEAANPFRTERAVSRMEWQTLLSSVRRRAEH